MIQGKWLSPGSDLSDALSVRQTVFGFGSDDLDPLAWSAVVYQDGLPVASGRIWWQDGAFRLGEIGVLPAFRSRRLGDLMLRLLLFKAQDHFAREVRLRCSRETEGFFSRLGFRRAGLEEDERPEDAELQEMMLPGDEIELDSCKSCKKANCPNRVNESV